MTQVRPRACDPPGQAPASRPVHRRQDLTERHSVAGGRTFVDDPCGRARPDGNSGEPCPAAARPWGPPAGRAGPLLRGGDDPRTGTRRAGVPGRAPVSRGAPNLARSQPGKLSGRLYPHARMRRPKFVLGGDRPPPGGEAPHPQGGVRAPGGLGRAPGAVGVARCRTRQPHRAVAELTDRQVGCPAADRCPTHRPRGPVAVHHAIDAGHLRQGCAGAADPVGRQGGRENRYDRWGAQRSPPVARSVSSGSARCRR